MIKREYVALSVVLLLTSCGCQEPETTLVATNRAQPTTADEADGHSHGDADMLVWVQRDIEEDDFVLTLGHHGEHFHGGDKIEPAVIISKDGEDVADAVVHNSLVAEDGETVLAAEKTTVFEPATEDEPAHYAQGGLVIPKDAKKFLVRFRIRLPESDIESTYDIHGEVSH